MTPLLFGTLLVAVCIKQGILQSNIVLSMSKEIVPENTSATLTCSKTTGSLESVKWITSMEENVATCGLLGETCLKYGFLTNNDLYDCICNDGTISVLLKNVDRYQHGATWKCEDIQSVSNTVVLNVSGILQSNIVLSLSKEIVQENTSATLTCSKTTGSLDSAKWRTSLENTLGTCGRSGETCLKFGFLTNNDLYDCICNDGTISVLLKNMTSYQHGATWRCEDIKSVSNTVVINISVPVTRAVLHEYSDETLYENSRAKFVCNTSNSLPPALISWYMYLCNRSTDVKMFKKTDQNVHIKSEYYTRDDNLVSTVETLSYKVNKSDHDCSVYCNASNLVNVSVMSNEISLSITYPPDGPPVIHGFTNGSKYKVVENRLASLSCSVEGGNPLKKPMLLCTNSINNTSETISTGNNRVTSSLTWTATRDNQAESCICRTDHILSDDFVFVNIDISYKASVTNFSVEGYEEQAIVTINESENIQLHCNIDSKPGSTIGLYFQGKHELHKMLNLRNLSYLLENVTCLQTGLYTCNANNEYNNGHTSIKILFLQVKCSPRRAKGALFTTVNAPVKDSATFSFTALAYPEPGPSGFKWHKLIGSTWIIMNPSEKNAISSSELTSTLTITNLTEPDYGNYMLRIDNYVGVYEEIFHLMISEEECPDSTEESSTIILSIVIGCIVTILVVTIVSVLFIITRRRRCETKKGKGKNMEASITKCRSFKEISEMAAEAEEETSFTNKTVYEEIKPDKDRGEIERMEKTYEQLGPDKDEPTSSMYVYTNLAL